jgi:hypothetical protein
MMNPAAIDPRLARLVAFNEALDDRDPADWCEQALAQRLDALLELENCLTAAGHARLFALSLARLAELALLRAGNCADAAQFCLAGDLLVTPRRVDVHLRGGLRALVHPRHQRLSDTLNLGGPASYRASWMVANAYPVVRREALIPELHRRLAACSPLSEAYLEDLSRRMGQVAATIAFLAAWQIQGESDLCRRWQFAHGAERDAMTSAMCRFEPAFFHDLGGVIRDLAAGQEPAQSAWLPLPAVGPIGDAKKNCLPLCQH